MYKPRVVKKSDKETSAQAQVSLYDFSPPEVYKSHILNRSFNKLYITCILIELLAQIKKILRYAMWQNQWDHDMPNSNTSSNTARVP